MDGMALHTRLRYSALIAGVVWVVWWVAGGERALFHLGENWHITAVMMFGSVVAGATSEGGGAIAFPFFTKVFSIDPWTAKLFSLGIQSVGMTAASLIIIVTRVKVDWYVIRWASLSGAVGMALGALYVAPLAPPDVTKMTFTVMATSFAIVLAMLHRTRRECHDRLPVRRKEQAVPLLAAGLIGGVLSSLVGTGIDILVFSVMVLLFRMSEKVATPTSVVLMAINSLVGSLVYGELLGQFDEQVFSYWMAAVPAVVVGAPMGAIACAYMSRTIIVRVLIALIFVELISSLAIIPMRTTLFAASVATFVICLAMFHFMYRSQRYEVEPS